jgi:phosphotransferase family enzyme
MRQDVCGTQLPELIRRAEEAFGLRLEAPHVLRRGRATVARAFLTTQSGRRLVIIKQFEEAHRDHFLRERAGLRVLYRTSVLQGLVPRLLADDAAGLVLLIDGVVERTPYADAVFAGDLDLATSTLTDTARRLGILHGHARFSVSEFRAEVQAPPSPGAILRSGMEATLAFLRHALSEEVASANQLEPGAEVHSQLMDVANRVDESDDLFTITLGDLAPSNLVLGSEGPVFIDFEYCGVRHAFYDAMYWHCICPFPAKIVDRMDEAYRAGLGTAGVRTSDEQYGATMLLFMSHRLFWTLSWGMESLFQQDRDVIPGVSTRRTICAYLREYLRFSSMLRRVEHTSLVSVAHRLEQRLSRLWSEPTESP